MSQSELEPFCRADNLCKFAAEDYPPCGEDFSHISPTAAPGDLCWRALWHRYEEAYSDTLPGRSLIKQASYLIELAMLPPEDVSNEEAANYFATAEDNITKALAVRQSSFTWVAQARLFKVFLPNYKAFREQRTPTAEDRSLQRAEIRSLMAEVQSAPLHTKLDHQQIKPENHVPCFKDRRNPFSMRIKLAFTSSCLKAGCNILVPTYRSRDHCDAFAVMDNHIIPVKVQNAKALKPSLGNFVLLYFEDLVADANRQLSINFGAKTIADLAKSVLHWIETDTDEPSKTASSALLAAVATQVRLRIEEQKKYY